MILKNIIEVFQQRYSEFLQEDWDNSGIQIADLNKKIFKVLFVIDITKEALEFSIDHNIDLIVSHHPLFFTSLKSLNASEGKSKLILSLIRNNIDVYSMHTNIDKVRDGVSDELLNMLNYGNKGSLDEEGFLRFTEVNHSFEKIALEIKEKFHQDRLLYYGQLDQSVNKIAVCGGSGGSFINLCIEKGIDLYITGDLKHHVIEAALLNNMNLIDLGHFDSEVHILERMKEELQSHFPEIQSYILKSNPYERKYL